MFHVQAAVAMAQSSRMPVLLAVPCSVMVSPNAACSPWNAWSLKAGFEVLINWATEILLGCCFLFYAPANAIVSQGGAFQSKSISVSLQLFPGTSHISQLTEGLSKAHHPDRGNQMNRKNMPGWLIVPVFLGLGVVFFFIGYWPDHSALEGALGVLAAICWFLIELAVHPY